MNGETKMKLGDSVLVYFDKDEGMPGTLRSVSADGTLATVFFGVNWQSVLMEIITPSPAPEAGVGEIGVRDKWVPIIDGVVTCPKCKWNGYARMLGGKWCPSCHADFSKVGGASSPVASEKCAVCEHPKHMHELAGAPCGCLEGDCGCDRFHLTIPPASGSAGEMCEMLETVIPVSTEMELHLLCEELSSQLGYTLRGKVGSYHQGEAMELLDKVIVKSAPSPAPEAGVGMPPYGKLLEHAKKNPPSQEWYDEDFSSPASVSAGEKCQCGHHLLDHARPTQGRTRCCCEYSGCDCTDFAIASSPAASVSGREWKDGDIVLLRCKVRDTAGVDFDDMLNITLPNGELFTVDACDLISLTTDQEKP